MTDVTGMVCFGLNTCSKNYFKVELGVNLGQKLKDFSRVIIKGNRGEIAPPYFYGQESIIL